MIIQKISLHNFRQYYGTVEFDLECATSKNISVIHGENGVGKTAFLNAIKWGFHGKFTNNFVAEQLINLEALSEGVKSCSVEIHFSDKNEDFMLKRVYQLGNSNRNIGIVNLYRIENGIYSNSVHESQFVINTILPEEMSDYFFFQGEGSSAFIVNKSTFDLKSSIQRVLGFDVAQKTLNRLKGFLKEVQTEISKSDKSSETEKLFSAISFNKDVLDKEKQKKQNIEITLEKLNLEYENIDNQLSRISNSDLAELRSREHSYYNELSKINKKLIELKLEKAKFISRFGWAVFGNSFSSEALEFVDQSVFEGRLPEPYNETFITEILKAAQCICGSQLLEGSPAYDSVKKLLRKAANPMLSARLGQVKSHIDYIPRQYENALHEIPKIISDIAYHEESKRKVETSLEVLNSQIEKIPEKEIQLLQLKKRQIKIDLADQNKLLGSCVNKISTLESKLVADNKVYTGLIGKTSVAASLKSREEFLIDLVLALEGHLEKTIQNVKYHIANKVNSILNESSAQALSIKFIDGAGFDIVVVNADSKEIAPSTGQTLLLNLSIVSALYDFIKNRAKAKDPLLSTANIAPLIVDAPFGVLDENFRRYVVKMLPKYAPQVIYLVSSSQWTEDMEEEVREQIVSEYCLISEQSEEQNDRPVRKYQLSSGDIVADRFGCERDRTVALRV